MDNNTRRSSASALAAAGGDEGDYDDAKEDRDMILSKEDFDLLHALHRFVPLPALSSNILRILCDDDLQVANEDNEGEDNKSPAIPTEDENVAGGDEREKKLGSAMKVSVKTSSGPVLSGSAATYAGEIPKHSPLTRRLSKKPHIEINLASPQYQKKINHDRQQQQDYPENNNECVTSYGSSPSNSSFSKPKTAGEIRTE